MHIDILATPSVDSTEEIEKAIKIMNQRQSYFRLRIGAADWVEKNVKSNKVIDYDKVYQEKKERLGESPVVIITKLSLKDGWSAYYFPGFYIISLGDWESRYQAPPLRVLLIYYLAGICCSFACNLPEAGHEEMYHDGTPIGCISDLCPKGDDDILLSMKGASICSELCTPTYEKYGCGDKELDAARRMLEYVKEEAIKYDKDVPYDVFISYSHEDKGFVDQLADDLEDRRLKVWRDGFKLLPGKTLVEQVIDGIDSSLSLLCVLSAKSVKSPWVKRELAIAVDKSLKRGENIIVLAITIGNCKIPKVLSSLFYVDFQSDYNAGLNKVMAAIREQKDKKKKNKKKKNNGL